MTPPAPAPADAPPFEWSLARHGTFQTCLRRYWFAYYGAWGGWRPDAPAPAPALFRLKRLATRTQWADRHVRNALAALFPADPGTDPAARELDLMRAEFRDSRTGAPVPPKAPFSGLFEHEYGIEVPPAEWKDLADRIPRAVAAFRDSPAGRRLAALPPGAFLPCGPRDTFLLDGLAVRETPDLAAREGDTLLLLDWDSADLPPADRRLRLGIGLLFALDRWSPDPARVRALSCDPMTGETADFSFTDADLETIRGFVRDSADEMLFPLEDPERNLPGPPDAFDCTADPAPCSTCPFLRLCPRWQP